LTLDVLAALIVVAVAAAAAEMGGSTAAPALELLAALPEGEVMLLEAPAGPSARPRLVLAARVKAPPARLAALLADPAAYRRAVPAFVRADDVRSEPGGDPQRPARLLSWELEIPLWNLEGRLWMRPRPDGAELELVAGDLAPGRFLLRALPDGARSILLVEGSADIENANWITRRLAARDPRAEPAMAATAAYVLLRALALEAERAAGPAAPPRWPRAAMSAPPPAALDGRALAAAVARLAAARPLRDAALAVVHNRPDGRLRMVEVGLTSTLPPAALQAGLGDPGRWEALPGWAEVEAGAATPAGLVPWTVDANMPFVDFDARWLVRPTAPFRASIQGGDWRGAVMGWDVVASGGGAAAVLSLHPRVETTGYLPRKLIAAEPLLEQGLALGLAYVDAVSLLRALERGAGAPPTQGRNRTGP
jgi:hypothetical protein